MSRARRQSVCLLILLLFMLTGCGKNDEIKETASKEPVKIPVVFLIDPATNLSNNQELVESFNKAYEGQYYVDVEWLTESAAGYREKLKQWNVLDEMPAVITDAGFDYDFYRMLTVNDRLVDLKPYMEEAPTWKDAIQKDILSDCTEASGEINLAPLASGTKSYAGIIYNSKLLKEAGYDEFPTTWTGFWECVNRLQEQGTTPLSLHGSGSYWVSMLMATSHMESTPEGKQFLNQDFPESYQNSSMESMMDMLDQMYKYTYEDALDIDFDEAARRFCDGEAAIFANGYWMLEEMSTELKENLRFAPFPGNILMNSPRMSTWAVTAGYDEELTKGAVKLLEYRIQQDIEDTEKLAGRGDLMPLEQSYIKAAQEAETIMPNYQMKWEQEIQNDFFREYIPKYLTGEIDKKAFMDAMDARVEEISSKK